MSQNQLTESLEAFAEQIFIFLSLLAIQRRLNCDEVYVLERASKVMGLLHPDANIPLFRHVATPLAPRTISI
jgi:hypothetical protein